MVKIIADSTCDLTDELLKAHDVALLPLQIILGENTYRDRIEITPDEIYAWSDAVKLTPKTAAPNTEQIADVIRPYYDQGEEVILMSISESMSSTASNMFAAAQSFAEPERITVIESGNLSTGFGLLVLEAAALAREGKPAAEIAAHIEALKPHIRASFVVDTLTYLHRSGRCSSVAAMAGGVLKLHPQIIVQDGKMSASKKYRGSMARVIDVYVSDLTPALRTARKDRVFITHSGCPAEIIEQVKAALLALDRFDEILITRAGSVISAHCGPGTLGVLFIDGAA